MAVLIRYILPVILALTPAIIYGQHKYDTPDRALDDNTLTVDSEIAPDIKSDTRKENRLIWLTTLVLAVSTVMIGWQRHKHQLLSIRQQLAEQEREKVRLENENLRLHIDQLKSERDELKTLPKHDELSQPIAEAIKERIEMLNALLAEKITDNDSYTKPYREWIDTITIDRERFMNSTRMAFKASHPGFMHYLEQRGLTEAEINYLCLYAIGLRGKEVGEYIQLRRHYHVSSEIRRKLGLNEHDTNLGIYVRKLLKQF